MLVWSTGELFVSNFVKNIMFVQNKGDKRENALLRKAEKMHFKLVSKRKVTSNSSLDL